MIEKHLLIKKFNLEMSYLLLTLYLLRYKWVLELWHQCIQWEQTGWSSAEESCSAQEQCDKHWKRWGSKLTARKLHKHQGHTLFINLTLTTWKGRITLAVRYGNLADLSLMSVTCSCSQLELEASTVWFIALLLML